ncbi:XRE family transcriptional regulator [Comamonas odontotermitis]
MGYAAKKSGNSDFKMTVAARLKEACELPGLTAAAISKDGYFASSTVNNWMNGVSSPSAEFLAHLQNLGVDVAYVLTGHRSAPHAQGTGAGGKVHLAMSPAPKPYDFSGAAASPDGDGDEFLVPLMNTKGGMGPGHHQVDTDVVKNSFPFSRKFLLRFVPESHLYDLRLIQSGGKSMLGTINDGDFSLVDTSNINHDIPGVFALEVHGLVYIKRVAIKLDGTKVVSSDNPDDPITEELEGDHQLKVLGRVVFGWNGRRF